MTELLLSLPLNLAITLVITLGVFGVTLVLGTAYVIHDRALRKEEIIQEAQRRKREGAAADKAHEKEMAALRIKESQAEAERLEKEIEQTTTINSLKDMSPEMQTEFLRQRLINEEAQAQRDFELKKMERASTEAAKLRTHQETTARSLMKEYLDVVRRKTAWTEQKMGAWDRLLDTQRELYMRQCSVRDADIESRRHIYDTYFEALNTNGVEMSMDEFKELMNASNFGRSELPPHPNLPDLRAFLDTEQLRNEEMYLVESRVGESFKGMPHMKSLLIRARKHVKEEV